jgi:hypothetical protein
MHRHGVQRAFAIILVAWFAALTAEPVTLHPCPMHDAVLLMQPRAGHHASGMSMPMSGDGAAMHAHGHDEMPAPHAPGHHRCTCLGHCTATSATALPASPLTITGALLAEPDDTGLPDHRYVPVATEHVLPFSNAPPLPPHAA